MEEAEKEKDQSQEQLIQEKEQKVLIVEKELKPKKEKQRLIKVLERIKSDLEKEDKETEIIATTTKEFSIITVDDRKLKSRNEAGNIPSLTKKSCLQIDSRNHIVFCKEGVLHIKDLFSQILSFNANRITKDNCIGGIRISKDLIAITSNKKIEGGKDSIKFYNPTLGKIITEIDII